MATPDTRAPGFFQGLPATPAAGPAAGRPRRPASPPPAAPSRTALLSPWTDSDKWDSITISGIAFTGKCSLSGDGVKKKNDHRSPRGRNGGRTVATGFDLVEITITLSAFPSEDHPDDPDEQVRQLDAIIARVASRAPSQQDAEAIAIAHPALGAMGLTSFTLTSIDLPEFEAGSTLNVTFKFKEHRPVTPRNVTRTPTTPAETQRPAAIAANNRGETIRPIPAPARPSASGAANPR
jgi:hypothetical protein